LVIDVLVSRRMSSLEKKKWAIRLAALTFTLLCSISLRDVGEPRPFYFTVIRGFGNSLFLNSALCFCAFRIPSGNFRYLMAILILLSGVGVFIIIPYGWTIATIAFLFHLWLVYELVSSKGIKWQV